MVYTRRSRAINSPRHLVIRHARRILNERKRLRDPELADPPPKLAPGEEQLYSFYIPGLEAGLHKVSVVQDIQTPAQGDDGQPQTLHLPSSQEFNVVAPRFTLPDGSIHSTYPPQGHGDTVNTLPHVVLNDPHLPWERIGSKKDAPDKARNRVPWLALLVFTQDELRLQDAFLNGNDSIFQKTKDLKKPVTQSTTLAINMKISDLWLTTNQTTPIKQSDVTVDATATTDVIFLQAQLFRTLVTTYDNAGSPIPQQLAPDVSRYKFLSHVRNINTAGMADAGVEDEGLFSIVVSHRVGPLTITQPTPVVVHLVSIENVESLPFDIKTQFVALSSLHSWTYTCLPPDSLNVYDSFRELGNTLNVLRAPDEIISGLSNQGPEAARVAQRLTDGYSLTRYRTQTGEETAALTRGPFTPTIIPHPLTTDWTSLSNFGTDLQILDQAVGLIDITYSSAWQLGKTLALADQAFTAALSRIRTHIHDQTMNDAKAKILRARGAYKTREEIVKSLSGAVETLLGLPTSNLLHGPRSMLNRWRRVDVDTLDLSYGSPMIDPIYAHHASQVGRKLASSTDGDGKQLYDETNVPYSTDWMVIFKWVLDRMYLVNVPAHYLITDPTHLPPESLRFFHIDANWVDALIDGALGVANHLDRADDQIRTAIKKQINEYLETVNPDLGYKPQIPTYGFLLRSELVTQFPDLMVQAPLPVGDIRAPILRHENIDSGVMLCLFDRVPSDPEFPRLTLAQPPHQQSFSAGASLNAFHITTSYKRVYTQEVQDPNQKEPLGQRTWNRDGSNPPAPPVFAWGGPDAEVRTLLFPAWAQDVFDYIKAGMNKLHEGWFTDTLPGSTLAGIQLNNPMYQLEILLKQRPTLESLKPTGPEHKTARTLKMLEPRVKKVRKEIPATATVRQVKEEHVMYIPPFGQRNRLTPLSLRSPPPHFRSLRTPAPRPQLPDDDDPPPAFPPKFEYQVYSTASKDNTVPTQSDVPLDLVFSVVLKEGRDSEFQMSEIAFEVHTGPVTDVRHNLTVAYQGPGGTMLSNLRFNVLVKNSDDGKSLFLRLLPRSRTGFVAVKVIGEMSFILSLVHVNAYTEPADVVTTVHEYYNGNLDLEYDFPIHLVPRNS
ncbi:hypothetical protein RUND412_000425 [Rhizina undulata]